MSRRGDLDPAVLHTRSHQQQEHCIVIASGLIRHRFSGNPFSGKPRSELAGEQIQPNNTPGLNGSMEPDGLCECSADTKKQHNFTKCQVDGTPQLLVLFILSSLKGKRIAFDNGT